MIAQGNGWLTLRIDGSVIAQKRQSIVRHFNRYDKSIIP